MAASMLIDVCLQPGECLVAAVRHGTRMLLGSCVSIALWHPPTRSGTQPARCQAKSLGGGNMFPHHPVAGPVHAGRRNGEAAREPPRRAGIAVVSESLFGNGHRQIILDIGRGDVRALQTGPVHQAANAGGRRT